MSEENTEPYYLLHRIKILESSYNEIIKYIDEIFEEIEQLKKKGTESIPLVSTDRNPETKAYESRNRGGKTGTGLSYERNILP